MFSIGNQSIIMLLVLQQPGEDSCTNFFSIEKCWHPIVLFQKCLTKLYFNIFLSKMHLRVIYSKLPGVSALQTIFWYKDWELKAYVYLKDFESIIVRRSVPKLHQCCLKWAITAQWLLTLKEYKYFWSSFLEMLAEIFFWWAQRVIFFGRISRHRD